MIFSVGFDAIQIWRYTNLKIIVIIVVVVIAVRGCIQRMNLNVIQ